MSATTPCRLLIEPPTSGSWNMALDEALLEWAAEGGSPVWRMYRWDEPTLSLGYFQDYSRRHAHQASRGCPAVRRLTGGGAILHDRELTYSLVVPEDHPLAVRRDRLYEAIHETLIEVLAQWGIDASFHGDASKVPRLSCGESSLQLAPSCVSAGMTAEKTKVVEPAVVRGFPQTQEKQGKPFLCFQRRSGGDLVVGGIRDDIRGDIKIVGSAQRRRGAVLQHGSILLQRSEAAPELGSIADVSRKVPDAEELIDRWLPCLSERLGLAWQLGQPPTSILDRAADLRKDRYVSANWTEHRRR